MLISRLRLKLGAAAAVAALAAVTACTAAQPSDPAATAGAGGGSSSTAVVASSFAVPADTHADANDGDYTASGATTIKLADGATAISGDGATLNGDVITITAAGTYIVSGTLSNGQLVVNSAGDGKVKIVLDDAAITSTSTSPVVVTAADEAVVILADGSTNTLADSAESGADDDQTDAPTATVFSMADLTIAGSGSLRITGNSNDGIASKDGLVILSGTLDVTAKDDGIRGKDYLVTEGGTITVTSGGDGLKSDNDEADDLGTVQIDQGAVTVTAGDDGVDAVGAVNIADGTLTIKKSTEGLEAAQITIAGGTVDVTADDDGLNATNGETAGGGEDVQQGVLLTISGGNVRVAAGQGDGVDSNGSATITGGTTVVEAAAGGGGGTGTLDVNGSFPITGGTLVALGGMSSAPATDSSQGWVAVTLTTAIEAGQAAAVVDSDGTVVARYVVTQPTTSMVIAADGITGGDSYDIYVGSADGATGFSAGGTVDGLTKAVTVTAGQFTNPGRGGGGRSGGGGPNR